MAKRSVSQKSYNFAMLRHADNTAMRINVKSCTSQKMIYDDFFSDGETTLVIINNENVARYRQRGIADLYKIVGNGGKELHNAVVIDKAIGKAAAALLVIGGAKQISTPRISAPALKMLSNAGIDVRYDAEVPLILNRTLTDVCPMERLCSESDDPREIFKLITDFIKEKQHGSNHQTPFVQLS